MYIYIYIAMELYRGFNLGARIWGCRVQGSVVRGERIVGQEHFFNGLGKAQQKSRKPRNGLGELVF